MHPALKIGMTPSEHTFNAFQSAWIERKYDLNKSTLFSYIWYEEKIFISYVFILSNQSVALYNRIIFIDITITIRFS